MSLALTGAGAAPSKVINTALEIWRDDVNAKGGLLGRPVELVIYDDQSTPANVPGIYTKLITVDKVDLLLGPYGTNFVAPAMPTIIQNKKMTISFTAIGINRQVQLRQILLDGVGRAGRRRTPSPSASSTWPRRRSRSRRPSRSSPPTPSSPRAPPTARARRSRSTASRSSTTRAIRRRTTDFAPVVRAVQATNPDIVYIGAYPPDNVGIIRAANEIGLSPKMFGGAMIGMLVTPIKVQLGPLANGLIIGENFAAAIGAKHPGLGRLPQALSAPRPRPPASIRSASPGGRSPTAPARCWRRR